MVCKRLMQHNQRINPLWCANLRYFSESTQRRNMATPPSCFTQELLCMQIDFLSDFMDKSYLCRKCRLPLNRHTQTTKGPCIYLDFFTESASGFLLVDEKCVYCSQPVYKHPQGPAPQRAPAAAATAQHGQARATLLAKTEQQVMEPSTAQDVDSSACALPAHTHTLCPGPSEGQQAAEAGDTASSVPTVKFLRDCARLCKKDNLNNVSAAIVLWDNSGIHRLFSIGAESMAFLADKQVHDAVFRAVGSRASDDLVLGLPALPELFVGVDKLRQCAKAVILATQRMRRHAFLQEQKAASEQAESRRPKSKADFFNHVHSPLENHIPPRFHAALSRVLTKAQLRGVVGSWSAIACKRAILAVYAELGLPTPSNAYWAPGARAAASTPAVAPPPPNHPNPKPPPPPHPTPPPPPDPTPPSVTGTGSGTTVSLTLSEVLNSPSLDPGQDHFSFELPPDVPRSPSWCFVARSSAVKALWGCGFVGDEFVYHCLLRVCHASQSGSLPLFCAGVEQVKRNAKRPRIMFSAADRTAAEQLRKERKSFAAVVPLVGALHYGLMYVLWHAGDECVFYGDSLCRPADSDFWEDFDGVEALAIRLSQVMGSAVVPATSRILNPEQKETHCAFYPVLLASHLSQIDPSPAALQHLQTCGVPPSLKLAALGRDDFTLLLQQTRAEWRNEVLSWMTKESAERWTRLHGVGHKLPAQPADDAACDDDSDIRSFLPARASRRRSPTPTVHEQNGDAAASAIRATAAASAAAAAPVATDGVGAVRAAANDAAPASSTQGASAPARGTEGTGDAAPRAVSGAAQETAAQSAAPASKTASPAAQTPTALAAPAPPIALQNVPLETGDRALPLAQPERKGAASTARGVEASLVAAANASGSKRAPDQLEARRSKRARSRQEADGGATDSAAPDPRPRLRQGIGATKSAKQRPMKQPVSRTRSGRSVKPPTLYD
eukprot:m.331476 g.331476  ORF g.331476 m.331476 type:complete len:953 (-) comp19770_c1_seq33:40-2898(-)